MSRRLAETGAERDVSGVGAQPQPLEPVIGQASSIRVALDSDPTCVTLVRALLSGVGERFELDPELIDDLKTAISEACNNAVIHAYPNGPGALEVEVEVDRDELRVAVIDHGGGIRQVAATADRMGVGLAVISALSDRAEFQTTPGGGTTVRMAFAARGRPIPVQNRADGSSAMPGTPEGVVRISAAPVDLLGEVLGRISRALAASAQFSLDRFSDLYLVTDEIAAHVRTGAAADGIACAISAAPGRLELAVGPFAAGTLGALASGERSAYSFTKLVDEIAIEPFEAGELLRVVVLDQR